MLRWLAPSFVIFLVFFLDQVTKSMVLALFAHSDTQDIRGHFLEITSYFHIVLVYNRGVSFGVFNGHSSEVFWLITIAVGLMSLYLMYWLVGEKSNKIRLSLALIVGGAFGNIYDRISRGAVVDFLDFFWHDYHWPAFNLADASIVIGVCLLMTLTILKEKIK